MGAIRLGRQVDVDYSLARHAAERIAKTIAKPSIPIERMGKLDEAGNVVAFFVSNPASYVVGAIILADGGMSAQ